MKLLFVHESKLKEDKSGNLYTGGSYSKESWDRYLAISSNFSTILRKEKNIYETEYAKQKFQFFDKDRINFIRIPDLSTSIMSSLNVKKREIKNRVIKEAVLNHDCVIARLPSSSGLAAIKLARKHNKPYLIELVGCPWDAFWNHSWKGKLVAPFMWHATKKTVKNAPYVLYVTNKFLQNRYPTNGHSTNCSNVALTEFDDIVLEKRLKRIQSMHSTNEVVIGTVAAVNVRYKGQQYVIEALGKLKREGITYFEYQLVGSGDQTFLKKVAEKHDVVDKVKFLGSMPHTKVFEWLETIDIYAQPSRQEGLPRALIEAMSKAVPAFGAKTAGIPELLEPEFIFTNTRKNIDEICKMLKSFNKQSMLIQAKRNYEESKKYDRSIIEKRRGDFFLKFAESKDFNS
jgi:glycosyltransferase involved in cell wall biosynthesis